MRHQFAMKGTVLLAAALAASVALGQGPPSPPGGGPGFGGPGGPGFGRGPMAGPRQSSAVQTPIEALAAGLRLSDDQSSRIQAIQADVRKQRESLMPRRGPGSDGGPPDFEAMRANFDKLRAAEQKANKDIEASLTDAQKKALPALLKQLDAWREADIPVELYGDLKLTADQQQKIDAQVKKARESMGPRPGGLPGDRANGGGHPGDRPGFGPPGQGERGFGGSGGPGGRGGFMEARRKMHDQAMAVLTSDQQKAVQDFIDAHPRPQFRGGPGGPGGFGPPPGGFGPPPGGGGGGPPPPGGDAPPPPPASQQP